MPAFGRLSSRLAERLGASAPHPPAAAPPAAPAQDGLVPCCYRIAQDGLPALLPHVTKQRFTPTVDELMALLQHRCAGWGGMRCCSRDWSSCSPPSLRRLERGSAALCGRMYLPARCMLHVWQSNLQPTLQPSCLAIMHPLQERGPARRAPAAHDQATCRCSSSHGRQP